MAEAKDYVKSWQGECEERVAVLPDQDTPETDVYQRFKQEEQEKMNALIGGRAASPYIEPPLAVAQNSQGTATPSPCGIALIISNRFLHTNKPFKGAKKDEEALVKLWEELHFDTRVLRDQTAKEMRDELSSLAKLEGYRKDGKDYKCVVVYILSHGSEGIVYDNHRVAVGIDELVQLVDIKQHSSLASKPKIFFIDACRGDNVDEGAAVAALSASSPTAPQAVSPTAPQAVSPTAPQSVSPTAPQAVSPTAPQSVSPTAPQAVSPTASQDSLPDGFLIFNATALGFIAWHNEETGSRFTRNLVAVFHQYHKEEHVEKMFPRVISEMNKDSECVFQAPWKRVSLTEEVFLRCLCTHV